MRKQTVTKEQFEQWAQEYKTAIAISDATHYTRTHVDRLAKQFDIKLEKAVRVGQKPCEEGCGCARHTMKNSGQFTIGNKTSKGFKEGTSHKWPKGYKPESFSFEGRAHTEKSKKRISENSWSRTEEGRRVQSERAKEMWKTRDRSVSEETRAKMSVEKLGKSPINKNGFERECKKEGCNKTFWVSPSRESTKFYCSKSHALSDRDESIIASTVERMHSKITVISQPELRLFAFLLLCGFDVYGQVKVGRFSLDVYDPENKLDWECDDNQYWHKTAASVERAPRRAEEISTSCLTTIRVDAKEIPSWEELENLL